MGDTKALCISPHSRMKEVILHYDIYTHYPSGNTDMHDQQLLLRENDETAAHKVHNAGQ